MTVTGDGDLDWRGFFTYYGSTFTKLTDAMTYDFEAGETVAYCCHATYSVETSTGVAVPYEWVGYETGADFFAFTMPEDDVTVVITGGR